MSNRPWYPWYPGDAAAKTAHLSLEEFGAYRRLLDHYYSTGRPLTNDPERLARIAGAQPKQTAIVRRVIDEFFVVEADGQLHNRRADQELARIAASGEINSIRGKKGAATRWSKPMPEASSEHATSNALSMPEAMQQACLEQLPSNARDMGKPQPDTTTIDLQPQGDSERRDRGTGKGGSNRAPPPRRHSAKSALPADFALSDRVRTWATEHGYGHLDQHIEAFRLKAQANGYAYADWDAALMEAIRKDWAGLRGAHGATGETLSQLLDRPDG
jgi:uncharacterized protein YdaU (DUF1376 family)